MCNIHVQVEIRKCENTIFEWKGPFHHIRQRTIYLRVHDSPSLAMKNHPLRLVSSQNSLKCCFRLPIARISWTICLLFVGPNGYRSYSCFYFVHINFLQTLRTLLSNFPSFPPSSSLVLPCQCNLFLSPLKADSFFLSSILYFPFKPRTQSLDSTHGHDGHRHVGHRLGGHGHGGHCRHGHGEQS